MQNRTPASPAGRAPVPAFTPVPRRDRCDGWTPDRQRAVIDALAELGSVSRAAKRINMAAEGAYMLRRAPGADEFRAAWDAALDHGVQRLADIAIDRAMEGVAVPVFWRGEQVGEKRWYNDRLLMFLLRHHQPARYGDNRPLPPAPRPAAAGGGRQTMDEIIKARHRAWEEGREERERREAENGQLIEDRINTIRRGYKREIRHDPAKRAAWELLVGPTDWENLDALPRVGNLPDTNFNRPDLIVSLAAPEEED